MTRLASSGGARLATTRARRIRSTVAILLAAGLLAAGCTAGPGDPGSNISDNPNKDLGGEAPMLAEKVAAGDLPAVEERLPSEPLEVKPTEQIGQYGGTWQTALDGPGDHVWVQRTIGYEGLVRWIPTWSGAAGDTEIIPNIAESYEVSADGTEFTFVLREGMRWSDGEPFTTEDIAFAYEDIYQNPDLAAISAIDTFTNGDKPAELQVDDERTFTFTFAEPAGTFIPALAQGDALIAPKHYLQEFHPDYNDALDTVVKDEGYGNWAELFAAKTEYWGNADIPTLHPWVITEPLGDGTVVTAERNPYYWKVDTEGNQLPYLDGVRYKLMNEEEVILAAAMQGDLDMHSRHINTTVNKPVLAKARDEGNFNFFTLTAGLANELVIMLNLTIDDETKREIFTNSDFRKGLSVAINREELINSVYQRQGTASQVAPQPTSPFYSEEMSTQYTEFDPDQAKQLLDAAGFDKLDSDGRRLGPDGKPIAFTVEHAGMPGFDDALALIADNWADVGITMTPDAMDRSLYEERRRANTPDASVWLAGGGTDVVQNPHWYLPISDRSDYAQLWAEWRRTGGESGEEPPAATKKQIELWDELQVTTDAAAQQELMTEILQIATEEFYHIGTVLPGDSYGIVSKDFHNVPEAIPDSFRVRTPALSNPEQYYKSE